MKNDNMQDILRNYYESGGKTLFESPEQISEIDFKNNMKNLQNNNILW